MNLTRSKYSIQLWMTVTVVGLALVLSVVNVLRQLWVDESRYRNSVVRTAEQEGRRLAAQSQLLMRRGNGSLAVAQLALSYAAADRDLRAAVVCDASNQVLFGTRREWTGLPVAETELAHLTDSLDEVRQTMEGRVRITEGRTRVVAAFPFWAEPSGAGVVLLEYELEAGYGLARSRAWHSSMARLFGLAGGCLALWMALHWIVTRRVKGLLTRVRQAQDRGVSVKGESADELSLVSRALDATVSEWQTSEARLSQVVSSMREIFWVAPAGRDEAIYLNAAYESMTGRERTVLTRRRWDWLRAVESGDRRRVLGWIQRARAGGFVEGEVRVRHPDGTWHWLLCQLSPFRDDQLAEGAIMALISEVTMRKELQSRLLDVAEKERQQVGMEIHDDLCQRLAGVRLKAGVLANSLKSSGLPAAQVAAVVASELGEATQISRMFANGLAPVQIDRTGIGPSLEKLAQTIERTFDKPCRVEVPEEFVLEGQEEGIHVFRIAQELLHNAAKHANPSRLWVKIQVRAGRLRLEVGHDGSAFVPDGSHSEGMGLYMMQQRLDALGATLRRFSRTQDGQIVQLAVCEVSISGTATEGRVNEMS